MILSPAIQDPEDSHQTRVRADTKGLMGEVRLHKSDAGIASVRTLYSNTLLH